MNNSMKHIVGTRGMVTAANALVASSGINILRQKGNAMDAATAMALTASVVLPDMCGIGGDAFFLYYDAQTQTITALNASGQAGKHYNKAFYTQQGHSIIPEHGILSIAVPGAVHALCKGLERYGTKTIDSLIGDAIHYAEHGYLLTPRTQQYALSKQNLMRQSPYLYAMYFNHDDQVKTLNTPIINPALAKSLKTIRDRGCAAFYHELAEIFIPALNARGAKLSIDDFAHYESDWLEPIKVAYKDHWVYQLPPVSQGIIHLEMLNILDSLSLKDMGVHSAEAIHHMIEAKKMAFNDRIQYFGDPKFHHNPVQECLSKEYGLKQAQNIQSTKLTPVESYLHLTDKKNTTSFLVVDEQGNACSYITSISDAFGSCVMDEATGILFNNRLGTNFNLVEGHPNCIAPHKQTMSTLMTYMITDHKGQLRYLGNTPGGDRQPQWNAQTVVNLLDYQIDTFDVFNQSYWYDDQTSNPYGKSIQNILYLEKSIATHTHQALLEKGYEIRLVNKVNALNQVIEIQNKHYLGVSDWRSDGIAIGY
jgi:gamma-glutamyltranspeptidase / glutathione hydrolase